MGSAPSWLSLLAPLPASARAERKPVASAEQLAAGTAGPIAGWQRVTVYLSQPEHGLRHLQVTLDDNGAVLSGGDHVMYVLETAPDTDEAVLTEHHSLGGRFERDGSFRGTCSKSTLVSTPGGEEGESTVRSAENRPPTGPEIAALRRLVEDVLSRA
jgi:hypothetical protein